MPGIRVREGEPIEKVLRSFKRQIERAGTKAELRKRECYDKPSVKKRMKSEAARRRRAKLLRKMNQE